VFSDILYGSVDAMLKFEKEVPCEGLTIYYSSDPQRLRAITSGRLLLAFAIVAASSYLYISEVVSFSSAFSLCVGLLTAIAFAVLSAVHTEKVTILADFGIQIERLRLIGPASRLLIEKSMVDTAFIHEAIRYVGVHFFLALRVRGSSELVPVFYHVIPALPNLVAVLNDVQSLDSRSVQF
jgi:hypothetical protein